MAWCTSPVHDGVGPCLDGSVLPLSRVLVLVIGFRLPITDVVGPEDVLDLVGDLNFGLITDKLVHSTTYMDVVFQSIDKLLTRPHGVDGRNQRLFPNRELCLFNPTIHSWGIRINSICSSCFMFPWGIEGRVPGLEMLFRGEGTYGGSPLSVCLKVSLMVSALTQLK